MRAVKLVLWSAFAYAVLLLIIRGAFPQGSPQTISLLGIPLLLVALIIARDLTRRSTNPTVVKTTPSYSSPEHDPVEFLRSQIGVAAAASDSYFDSIVRMRLKGLLTDKVSLETGLEKEVVGQMLKDPTQARQLLHNDVLIEMLVGPVPKGGADKLKMISRAVDMIGEWKG